MVSDQGTAPTAELALGRRLPQFRLGAYSRLVHGRPLDVAAVLLLAVVIRLLLGPAALTPDAGEALYWGRQLADGHLPVYITAYYVVPHPLWIFIAAGASLIGHTGYSAISQFEYLSAGAIVWGAYRLGAARLSWVVGLLAALFVLGSGSLISYIGLDLVDVPFAAFIVWALVLEMERPRRGTGVLVVLALAGLLRPDAWLLSGVYWIYLWRAKQPNLHLGRLAVIAASAPVLWMGWDLVVAGNPLFSLHVVDSYARATHWVPVRLRLPHLMEQWLSNILGGAVLAGGLIGAVLSVIRRDRRVIPITIVVVVGLINFSVTALQGLSLQQRFLTYEAIGLAALSAYFIVEAWKHRGSSNWSKGLWAISLILLVWFLAGVPHRLTSLRNARSEVRFTSSATTGLAAFASQPAVQRLIAGCGHFDAVDSGMLPPFAWAADVPQASMPRGFSVPSSGAMAFLTVARSGGSRAAYWEVPAKLRVPAGFGLATAADGFALYTRGC